MLLVPSTIRFIWCCRKQSSLVLHPKSERWKLCPLILNQKNVDAKCLAQVLRGGANALIPRKTEEIFPNVTTYIYAAFLHSYFMNEVRENLTRSVLRSPEQYAVITHPFRFFLAINERSKTRLDVFSFVMVLKNLDITSCQQSDLQFKSPFTVTINADGQCSVSLLSLFYSYINRFCTIFWVPPLSSSMSRVQFRTRDICGLSLLALHSAAINISLAPPAFCCQQKPIFDLLWFNVMFLCSGK